MFKKLSETATSRNILSVLLLSTLFFGLSIGFEVLRLDFVDWMLVREDPSNHLMGWLFFQASPWQWPPGATPLMLSPTGASIGKTDSIPLLAYTFKLFRDFLPYPSQYFGWALWISYTGLGLSSFNYLKKRSQASAPALLLAVAVILCSPVFFNRISRETAHIALTFHFLLIAALAIWNQRQDSDLNWKKIEIFNILILASSMIHPFLWIMLVSLHFPMMGYFGWRHQRLTRVFIWSSVTLALSVLCLKISGILGGEGDLGAFGFGIFSANLLSFIDPNQFSRWMPDLPSNPGQNEGMAYLGFGVLILLLAASWSKIQNWKAGQWKFKISPCVATWTWALALGFVSLSQRITWGENEILDLTPLYEHLNFITGPLRSSGRLIWPLYYLIALSALTFALRLSPRKALGILILSLSLQVAEVFPFQDHHWPTWTSTPPRDFLTYSDLQGVDRIRFYPPVIAWEKNITDCMAGVPIEYPDYLRLAISAAGKEIPINSGIASRFPWQQVEQECRDLKNSILTQSPASQKTLFVFHSQTSVPTEKLNCQTRGPTLLCRLKN